MILLRGIMSESRTLKTLRLMAWERAKGELNAYLQTFWPDFYPDGKEIDHGYDEESKMIMRFIKEFEENKR